MKFVECKGKLIWTMVDGSLWVSHIEVNPQGDAGQAVLDTYNKYAQRGVIHFHRTVTSSHSTPANQPASIKPNRDQTASTEEDLPGPLRVMVESLGQ
jgi:hypothetical protein